MFLFSIIHIFVIHLTKNSKSQSEAHGIMNVFLLETKHKEKLLSLCTHISKNRDIYKNRDTVVNNAMPKRSQIWLVVVYFVLKIVP